jgi:hypothetical protein
MPFTAADLTAIETALASGELSAKVGDREVTYRSVSDLERARRLIKAELDAQGNTAAVRRGSYSVRFTTARGD